MIIAYLYIAYKLATSYSVLIVFRKNVETWMFIRSLQGCIYGGFEKELSKKAQAIILTASHGYGFRDQVAE